MTRRRQANAALVLALVGLGLAATAVFVDDEPDETAVERQVDRTARATRQRGHWARTARFGGVPSLPVDPASPSYEGKENDDWDELDSNARIERTEEFVSRHVAAIDAASSTGERARLRERALLELSVARAEYFATEDGAQRYTELERELELEG